MNISLKLKYTKIALALNASLLTGILYADPPASVGRLSFIDGTVTFSPAGSEDWANATLNRPLVSGDRLWDDAGAKSEIQFNDSAIRMSEKTSVNALNLADKTAQIQLSQGSVCLYVKSIDSDQIYEVDTPNLAFSVLQPGDYRIDVSADGKTTTVSVRTGGSQVSSEGASYTVDANKSYNFTGTKLEHTTVTGASTDDFDKWCAERNELLGPIASAEEQTEQIASEQPTSEQNVSEEIPGSQELDNSGSWGEDPTYGKSWTPGGISSGWEPYTDGRWVWISSLGWTWIDNAPWGFTPFHYGNWVLINGIWSWIPGFINMRPVFSPALVGFLPLRGPGGLLMGWFPLLPGDLYIPPYQNFPNRPGTYVNIVEPDRITAMTQLNFVNSMQANQATVPVTPAMVESAKAANNPGVVPTSTSLLGGEKTTTSPPPDVLSRPAIAKTTPPPAPIPFDAQLPLLNDHPGTPLTPAEVDTLKPGDWTDIVVIKHCPKAIPIDESKTGVAKPPSTNPVVKTHAPVQVKPIQPKKVKKAITPKTVKPKVYKKTPKPKVYKKTYKPKIYKKVYKPKIYKKYKKYRKHYPKYYPVPQIQFNYPQQQYHPQPHYQPHYTPPTCGGGGGHHGGCM